MYIVYITFDTMLKGIIHYFSCCQKALQLPRTFNHDTSLENDNCVVEAFHHCWYKIIVRQFKNRQEEKQRKYNCNKFQSQSQMRNSFLMNVKMFEKWYLHKVSRDKKKLTNCWRGHEERSGTLSVRQGNMAITF